MTTEELNDLAFELAHERTALEAGQFVRRMELPEHFLLEVFHEFFLRVNWAACPVERRARLAKVLRDLRAGYHQSQ